MSFWFEIVGYFLVACFSFGAALLVLLMRNK